ncbi:hypothetical protein U9M48_026947 [Paspalum notatum var. saurae]|uniref:DCD domain-containing protein n=1 Tax=Paspalum notatum var. saurae TaxID=547442 RepID=A0AAQ3WYU2_PASNO
MWREGPTLSFRQGAAAGDMAGAIFMSNTLTRDQCFQAGVFGLPFEYRPFVSNVRKGMPLFLFDHTLRKLYGVFEAASDGGLNINYAALRSFERSYPAEVRFNVVWKCRPLSEDEFFPAIEDNYYQPRKFYFDLSYEQVVRLYELFDGRRVGRPIYDYPKNESFETNQSRQQTPDKEILIPDVPHSNDQSCHMVPNISGVIKRYATPTSMQTDLPLNVEAYPNMSMPLGTENFGVHIAPTLSHHNQIGVHSQNELYPTATVTDAVSTQVSASFSQASRHHQLAAKESYLLPQDYPRNILSSECTAQVPRGAKFVANESCPLSCGCLHNGLLTSRYATQNPTYRGKSHLNSTFTPYDRLYPHLLLSNPQSNSDYQVNCDICFNQSLYGAHNDIHACECQCSSEGEALTLSKLSKQGIATYPEVVPGKTVSKIEQQKKSSTEYIQIPHCDRDFENDKLKLATHRNTSSSPDPVNDIVDPRHTQHAIGAESNIKDRCSPPQRSAFSRLSASKQLVCQEATGPTLNHLVSSLCQKTEQWRHTNRLIADDLVIPLTREQAVSCPFAELNLPNQLELGGEYDDEEESIEPQVPFLNFKRRSEAGKFDANLGNESGEVKRRKLVRPSFGENNASTNTGEELKGNCTQVRNQNDQGVTENHSGIDLNVPAASVESCLLEEKAVCPSVVIKVQTEKSHEIDMNMPNSDVIEMAQEKDSSSAPVQKVSIDFNIADLNTMDELKLRAILDQTSTLLVALGKLKTGKSNNSEEAGSTVCGEDRKVNMVVNSDGEHNT